MNKKRKVCSGFTEKKIDREKEEELKVIDRETGVEKVTRRREEE